MRGHVAKKGKNYYAVVYQGTDPATGKDRYRWHAAGSRRDNADRLLNDLIKRRHDGETDLDRTTLGAYLLGRWLPLQEPRLRPTTFASYRNTIRLHIAPTIGHIRLDRLQADDLDRLYLDLLRNGNKRGTTGGRLSPTTVRYVHRLIGKALSDAVRKGAVARNVALLADPPKRASSRSGSAIHVWEAAELRRFLDATADHPLHALLTVAAKTGMRRGELVGLRWDAVDLDASTLSVQQTTVLVDGKEHESDAKTATGRRTIDLDARTVELLRDLRRTHQREAGDEGGTFDRHSPVFRRDDGGPVHPEIVSRTFDRLVAEHGLPRIRFHDIRHTHATLLLKAGVPVKVVSERLGHANPGFTLNVYQHVLPGMQAEAARVFDDLLRDDTPRGEIPPSAFDGSDPESRS